MRHVKLQQEILKSLASPELYNTPCIGQIDDDQIFISNDGIFGMIIPSNQLMLNVSKFQRQVSVKHHIKYSKEAETLIDTGTSITLIPLIKKSKKLRKFKSASGKYVYIEEKVLSYFGKYATYKYNKGIIYIYEFDILYGITVECNYNDK